MGLVMPIPHNLHAEALPEYSPEEERDYDQLNSIVLRGLRDRRFPFSIELRTKRHNGWYVGDVDFSPSAIQRNTTDLQDAGFLVTIKSVDQPIASEGGGESITYQVMTVNRRVKPDLPPPYSK